MLKEDLKQKHRESKEVLKADMLKAFKTATSEQQNKLLAKQREIDNFKRDHAAQIEKQNAKINNLIKLAEEQKTQNRDNNKKRNSIQANLLETSPGKTKQTEDDTTKSPDLKKNKNDAIVGVEDEAEDDDKHKVSQENLDIMVQHVMVAYFYQKLVVKTLIDY